MSRRSAGEITSEMAADFARWAARAGMLATATEDEVRRLSLAYLAGFADGMRASPAEIAQAGTGDPDLSAVIAGMTARGGVPGPEDYAWADLALRTEPGSRPGTSPAPGRQDHSTRAAPGGGKPG